jgi:hypothetical protein
LARRAKDEAPKWASGLKAFERLFIENFPRTGKAGPSYRAIAPGATAKSCREAGHRWRKRLASAIAAATEERSELLRGGLVEKLKIRGGYDIGDYIDANGEPKFKSLDELTEEQRLAIDAIENHVNEGGYRSIKVKFADRTRAIELLAKMIGLLKPANLQVGVAVQANIGPQQVDPVEMFKNIIETMAKRNEQTAKLENQPQLRWIDKKRRRHASKRMVLISFASPYFDKPVTARGAGVVSGTPR